MSKITYICKNFIYYTNYIKTMSKYSELIYMVLDEIKGMSDDFSFTEDHVAFLLDKYRGFLLKQRYSDVKKQIPESNYQTIKLELEKNITHEGCCGGFTLLKSKEKIPFVMPISTPKVYPCAKNYEDGNYYIGNITYVSKDRMKYTGYNKYLQNIVYCSIAPDGYLYLKSPRFNIDSTPEKLGLEYIMFSGIFQDPKSVAALQGDDDTSESEFPLEDALIPPLIELVTKELVRASLRMNDNDNNAKDDLAGSLIRSGRDE